jgi:hypothetical protein
LVSISFNNEPPLTRIEIDERETAGIIGRGTPGLSGLNTFSGHLGASNAVPAWASDDTSDPDLRVHCGW